MEVITELIGPPARVGCLGGGIALLDLGATALDWPLLFDCEWLLPSLALSLVGQFVPCRSGASDENSLCKGEEAIGDADFLLWLSPLPLLPPFVELRGETRPV